MGIIDNYPPSFEFIDRTSCKRIETACLEWRWRIKDRTGRLCQVHGDFHPWNILFRTGTDFTVLDRSRGEWGEPADDVATMSLNYLFFSLQRSGRLEGDLEALFRLFWDTYLERTGDREIARSDRPLLCLARPGHRKPRLVSPPFRLRAQDALHVHRERACCTPVRPRGRNEVPGMTNGFALWLTGIPASGKSSVTRELVRKLRNRQVPVVVLESDRMRTILTPAPTYSEEERDRFYRQLVQLGEVITGSGVNVIFDATANKRAYRDAAPRADPPLRRGLSRLPAGGLRCPGPQRHLCQGRAEQGLATVPGLQAAYEPPLSPGTHARRARHLRAENAC